MRSGAADVSWRKMAKLPKVPKPKVRKYTLRELVSKITPKNRHKEVDFGRPRGKEMW